MSILLNCKLCKKQFVVQDYRKDTAKFCSTSCSTKYNKPQRKTWYVGKDHPMWKGGVQTNTQGYKLIYSPDHPYKNKQGYVREHRLVVEKQIGRYLLPSEVVHHINEVKDDNRFDNLQVLLKKEHDTISIHNRPLKGEYKVCPICRKKFYVHQSRLRVKTCSKSCGIKLRWIVGGLKSFNR